MFKNTGKPFLTYEEQLQNLQQNKLLIVNNPAYAISKLQEIRYFALIDGYKDLFYNPMTRQYLPHTTFEDIVYLYNFDEKLRLLVFQYLNHFEQKIRSYVSYYFCDTYSSAQSDYLNPANYNTTPKNQDGISKLIKILNKEANYNNTHPYIVYQRKTHNNVPLRVLVNTLTFGQISKMYSFLPNNIQAKISLQFHSVNEKELLQYLKVLTDFRNVCAHNERLFSFRCRAAIPNTILHKKMDLSKIGSYYRSGKNDMFALVIAFRYLLNKEDFLQFKKGLCKLLISFSKCTPSGCKEKLLDAMGFPNNWFSITKYKF